MRLRGAYLYPLLARHWLVGRPMGCLGSEDSRSRIWYTVPNGVYRMNTECIYSGDRPMGLRGPMAESAWVCLTWTSDTFRLLAERAWLFSPPRHQTHFFFLGVASRSATYSHNMNKPSSLLLGLKKRLGTVNSCNTCAKLIPSHMGTVVLLQFSRLGHVSYGTYSLHHDCQLPDPYLDHVDGETVTIKYSTHPLYPAQ